MKSMRQPEKWEIPAAQRHTALLQELPPSILKWVGRVAFKLSILEFQIAQVVYALVGVDRRIGRLAVRSPRASEMIEMIHELAHVKSLKCEALATSVKPRLEHVQMERDLLIHGLWVKDPRGLPAVISVNGPAPVQGAYKGRKRRIEPVSVTFSEAACKATLDEIEALTLEVDGYLRRVLQELGTSPEKLRAPPLPALRADSPIRQKPSPQRRARP
ncbi:MAG: hypothetical protein Q8M96_14585, partial [Rubrivivax sp.]|nr:hypothetical protein [Rubrivivax sp.]